MNMELKRVGASAKGSAMKRRGTKAHCMTKASPPLSSTKKNRALRAISAYVTSGKVLRALLSSPIGNMLPRDLAPNEGQQPISGPARFDLDEAGVFQEDAIVRHADPHHFTSENHSCDEAPGDGLWRLEINDEALPVRLQHSVHLREGGLLKVVWQVVNRQLADDKVERPIGKGYRFGQAHLEIQIHASPGCVAPGHLDHFLRGVNTVHRPRRSSRRLQCDRQAAGPAADVERSLPGAQSGQIDDCAVRPPENPPEHPIVDGCPVYDMPSCSLAVWRRGVKMVSHRRSGDSCQSPVAKKSTPGTVR